jgi:O-acetyl-ADP-ribose deacetylase (regulator of RNase III)
VAARDAGAKSIAFPALSTGIYGYPKRAAAEIAVRTLLDCATGVDVTLVAFDAETFRIYEELLR